jgi:hypothetical protein
MRWVGSGKAVDCRNRDGVAFGSLVDMLERCVECFRMARFEGRRLDLT